MRTIIENATPTTLTNRLVTRYGDEGQAIADIIVNDIYVNRSGTVDVAATVGGFRAYRLSTGLTLVKF
jgi:hypothetical protein